MHASPLGVLEEVVELLDVVVVGEVVVVVTVVPPPSPPSPPAPPLPPFEVVLVFPPELAVGSVVTSFPQPRPNTTGMIHTSLSDRMLSSIFARKTKALGDPREPTAVE